MTTTSTAAPPWWRRSTVILGAVVLVVVVLMLLSTTFVKADANSQVAADTAVEFAELNYSTSVVPTITDNAVDIVELAEKMQTDPEATGEELGRREDENKPYSFSVTATGTVVDGAFGEVGLEVDGMPDGMTVGIAVPPLGSSTALRDAGTDVTFGDFVNQTEYQNVAIELNKLAAADVYDGVDVDGLVGQEVTVTGAVTWSSKTGGEVTHLQIVPVSLEVTS
ncbi:MAG TPA: hypothetical protein DHV14_14880 [Micrococcales bacterium]|uniref:DUF2291 family protein n=1 Tax=Miniimonas arenae TaxID=676201 RepID=UPI000ED981D2|nr:DUF2291 family protein [Miniimonas arenae]HCX86384.1 hypothetical protein [Micrococcales bacterium]